MTTQHILIVEDNEDSRELLHSILEDAGFKVTATTNGHEALAAARSQRPDLVISDILMPGMDGFRLCRAWMADISLRDIPFVFYSATFTQADDQRLALSLGARDYLIKPQEPHIVLAAVRRALDPAAARSAATGAADGAGTRRTGPSLPDDATFVARHDAALTRKLDQKVVELENAHRRLQESERAYRLLFDANPNPMWVFDVETLRFLAVNHAAVVHYGYSPDEFRAMTIVDIRPARDIPRLLASIAKDRVEGYDNAGVWQHRRKDGSIIDVEIISHALEFQGRKAEVVMATDITERMRTDILNQRYMDQLKAAFLGTVSIAMDLGEMRDPYTAGHQRRVGDIGHAIARELGLDEHRCEGVRVAGYLHDIGKLAVPAEILSSPRKLSELEYDLVKGHAEGGYEALRKVDFPWPVADVALQHHERMDGSGYPAGLVGEDILLEARIIAVADVVESMASHRPYRPALGLEAALLEIERGRGTLYDAAVADACLKVFREKIVVMPDR